VQKDYRCDSRAKAWDIAAGKRPELFG
jgi:hypothetical protein